MSKDERKWPLFTAYDSPDAPYEDSEPECAPAESIVTPEEVIRNGVGELDVERLREWGEENQL